MFDTNLMNFAEFKLPSNIPLRKSERAHTHTHTHSAWGGPYLETKYA